ncbi:MAG: ribosome maturation factor RimM [Pseudomonadota bacterium]
MIVMGRVAAPFGVKGWIKVQAYTEVLDSLCDYPVWWLGREGATADAWREVPLAECAVHGQALVARLEGCNDRDAAAMLRGLQIAVPRAQLPPSGKDEFYWADLIGLAVVNRRNEQFGTVAELFETGANDVLVVRGGPDGRERLIPFVASVIDKVDLAARRITVDWEADY